MLSRRLEPIFKTGKQ